MELTKRGEKRCAYPHCNLPVDDDDKCSGCGFYICEKHCANAGVMGRHDVVEHWAEEDAE